MAPVEDLPCWTTSVAFGNDAEISAVFERDGVVVVEGVLEKEEVHSALHELWTSPRLLGRSGRVSRSDVSSWGSENWPQQDGGRNFFESLDAFQDHAGWELLQNPRVLHLQRLLHRGPVMSVETSRWGVMRPTALRPEWRTEERWLHWDQNPWREPGFARLQSFLCITAQTPTSGGLLCVPGFQHRWRQWGQDHPMGSVEGRWEDGAEKPFLVPEDDPLQQQTVRVLAPSGALVVWDGRIPHQNYPNTGHDFRVVHYLAFIPWDAEKAEERRQILHKRLVIRQALGTGADAFFPRGLSALGREVLCLPLEADGCAEDLDPRLLQAIMLTVEAGEDELRGDLGKSVEKMRRATKAFPEIESWHDAIFGN